MKRSICGHRTGPLRARGSRSPCGERGNVLIYIFIAIALLGALTFSFTKGSRENISVQVANQAAQELYVQANLIRTAISECTLLYPGGGGDLAPLGAPDGVINADDNPNTPYPLNPTSTLIPGGASGTDDLVRNVVCLKSDSETEDIFQETNSRGRFLPPPPPGWGEWMYSNAADGVKITITAPAGVAGTGALERIEAKFTDCQADVSGSTLTVWIKRVSC